MWWIGHHNQTVVRGIGQTIGMWWWLFYLWLLVCATRLRLLLLRWLRWLLLMVATIGGGGGWNCSGLLVNALGQRAALLNLLKVSSQRIATGLLNDRRWFASDLGFFVVVVRS